MSARSVLRRKLCRALDECIIMEETGNQSSSMSRIKKKKQMKKYRMKATMKININESGKNNKLIRLKDFKL